MISQNISQLYSPIISDVEHSDEVMHAIQLRFKEMSVTDKNANDLSDYDIDPTTTPPAITSDETKKSYSNSDCKIFSSYFFFFISNNHGIFFITQTIT